MTNQKSHPASLFVIQWVNCLALGLSMAIVSLGVVLGTRNGDCEHLLTTPILLTGGFIFCVSLVGFIGALKEVSLLLWAYMFLVCLLLGTLTAFTIFAFVVTNRGESGHNYKLQDYSGFMQKMLHDKANWSRMKSCFVKIKYCSDLELKYPTLLAYKHASLTPIEAGCCKPPSECSYQARNASYYDLRLQPMASLKDCKIYKNKLTIKCYDCDSCRGAVAHYLRKEWRIIALVNIVIFIILIVLYSTAYYTRRMTLRSNSHVASQQSS